MSAITCNKQATASYLLLAFHFELSYHIYEYLLHIAKATKLWKEAML